jgi:hypothetical protein
MKALFEPEEIPPWRAGGPMFLCHFPEKREEAVAVRPQLLYVSFVNNSPWFLIFWVRL